MPAAEQAMEGGVATAEPLMEEEDEEEDWRRGSSVTGRLAPLQAPAPEAGRPVGPGFWHLGQDIWVAWWGMPASAKARGKVPAVEPLPPEMDEKLVRWLQWE